MSTDRLAAAVAEANAALGRADTKAATLLALSGTALTIELAVLGRSRIPLVAVVGGWVTVVLTATAVLLLALSIRPNLNGGYGVVRYAAATPEQVRAELTDPTDTAEATDEMVRVLGWACRAAVVKYRRIRCAVTLLLVGLGAALLTIALATL